MDKLRKIADYLENLSKSRSIEEEESDLNQLQRLLEEDAIEEDEEVKVAAKSTQEKAQQKLKDLINGAGFYTDARESIEDFILENVSALKRIIPKL